MEKFKIGNRYQFRTIENASKKAMNCNLYGRDSCGQQAIHLSYPNGEVWFILDSANQNGFVYKCMFNQ
jgi:hypothetical protein